MKMNSYVGLLALIAFLLPKDARFHIFLLDSSGVPVFVGDPLKGNKAYKQFENIISR